jgi:hypothetical protein
VGRCACNKNVSKLKDLVCDITALADRVALVSKCYPRTVESNSAGRCGYFIEIVARRTSREDPG